VLLAVAATALAAWLLLRTVTGGAPTPVALIPGTPMPSISTSSGASGATPGAQTTAPAQPDLVVHVLGEVKRPGLVRLPPGSRVADAIAAAGGLRSGGSSGELNLARLLVDGEQVEVSHDAAPDAPAPSDGGAATGPVNLNTATLEQLDTLPGVGPVMAGRILDWRTQHGRFASVDQLREVSGIGDRTFERLSPLVVV